jgi:hypothetical protein
MSNTNGLGVGAHTRLQDTKEFLKIDGLLQKINRVI